MSPSRPNGSRNAPAARKKTVPTQARSAAERPNSRPIAGRATTSPATMNGASEAPSATAARTRRRSAASTAIAA